MTAEIDITDHVAYERGKHDGKEAGKEAAWLLLETVAQFYKNELDRSKGLMPIAENTGRWKAILYAQQVIKRGSI